MKPETAVEPEPAGESGEVRRIRSRPMKPGKVDEAGERVILSGSCISFGYRNILQQKRRKNDEKMPIFKRTSRRGDGNRYGSVLSLIHISEPTRP